jgi:hypothetical protein
MINENTLKVLNKYAFGADIDSLESYIIDFKQSNLVADMTKYEYNYMRLLKILKEVKPESKAFSDETSLEELEVDKFDRFFTEYSNPKHEVIYGSTDTSKLEQMKELLDSYDGGTSDIIAIANVTGLDVMCTYINGKIYRIYLIGEFLKYTNITEIAKELVPEVIEDFKKYKLVECRGKITIFNTDKELQSKSLNICCSTMRCIRTNIEMNKLKIVFNNIFIDDENIPYENQWEKIEYMRSAGLSVPHHGLIRDIDRELVAQALKDLDNYIQEIKETEGIVYDYNGILIRVNNDETDESSVIYNTTDVDYRQKFSSTVKSISQSYDMKQNINIVKIACNDRTDIDTIEIEDIYELEEHSVRLGKKIIFNVIEGVGALSK